MEQIPLTDQSSELCTNCGFPLDAYIVHQLESSVCDDCCEGMA